MKGPQYEVKWWEVHFRWATDTTERRIDRRRRSKATCERIASALRAQGNCTDVWLVEVCRLTRGFDPRKMRRA